MTIDYGKWGIDKPFALEWETIDCVVVKRSTLKVGDVTVRITREIVVTDDDEVTKALALLDKLKEGEE